MADRRRCSIEHNEYHPALDRAAAAPRLDPNQERTIRCFMARKYPRRALAATACRQRKTGTSSLSVSAPASRAVIERNRGQCRQSPGQPLRDHRGDNLGTDLTKRIVSDARYQRLKSRRSRFGWLLAVAMLIVYYGFILLVAFNKPLLGTRLGEGVTTIGMPLGLGVIVFTIVITGIYVRRANSEYDELTEQIARGVLK
jgi:uncharacterized membrane protein (DUF485 family)